MIQQETIGLTEARKAIDAVLNSLRPDERPAAVAVVDAHGVLVSAARQDGAATRMLRRAHAKAYTAALMGMDTIEFRDRYLKAEGRHLSDYGDSMLTALPAGTVLMANGEPVGGVGVSGNVIERDQELAGIARDALGLR